MKKLNDLRFVEYESWVVNNEKINRFHDQEIIKNEFSPSYLVILFHSRFLLFPDKLMSKLTGPFTEIKYFHMELLNIRTRGDDLQGERS